MSDAKQIVTDFEAGLLTVQEAMTTLANRLPEDDPERLFVEWLNQNHDGIHRGCLDLGIDPPSLKTIIEARGIIIPLLANGRHPL